jgi:4-hydroxy-tetrahydrodipicolinate synthase
MTDRAGKENTVTGVWVPIVTPFRGGEVDYESLGGLTDHLVSQGVSGLVAAATTGECMTLSEDEHVEVARTVMEAARGCVPVLAGMAHAGTRRGMALLGRLQETGVDGALCVCPPFVRPDQRGIIAHFQALASETKLPLLAYNIPYRTGVNMGNETIRILSRIKNIVGLKDSSGDMRQSVELLLDPPEGFSILAGEDVLFYSMLAAGAHGGILASAHWATRSFIAVWRAVSGGDHGAARERWRRLAPTIPLFFQEPNPVPIKHFLFARGLISSPEVRLPLVPPTDELKAKLETLAEGAE